MRIAVSGAHATGKSTLIAELARANPDASTEDEAYVTLMGDGTAFAARPDAADYALLCERACRDLITEREGPVLFDRTPADYLAYLVASGGAAVEPELVDCTKRALSTLDLVVYVPIETPDRVSGAEQPRLRRAVDRILHDMWVDDGWGWSAPVLAVQGPVPVRVAQVLSHERLRGPHGD